MNKYSDKKICWFNEKLHSLRLQSLTSPICVRIKPTNRCSHNCSWCIYKPDTAHMHQSCNRTDEIPTGRLTALLEELADIGCKSIIFTGGGEPLIHPGINEAMAACVSLELDYAFITNGQHLLRHAEQLQHAKWIRVSADYWDKQSFSQSRGLDERRFDEILDGIKALSDKTEVGINYIISKESAVGIVAAGELFKSVGAQNIRYSPLWIKNFTDYHSYMKPKVNHDIMQVWLSCADKDFKVYSSYNIDDIKLRRTLNRCYMNQVTPSIGADQNIYCCHNQSYTTNGLVGSIKDMSFGKAWMNAQAFFKAFDPTVSCNGIQCANEFKNNFIHEIIDSYGDNFV